MRRNGPSAAAFLSPGNEMVNMRYRPKHKSNKTIRHGLLSILIVLLLCVFTYSAVKLTQGLLEAKKERDAFAALAEIVVRNSNPDERAAVQKEVDGQAHGEGRSGEAASDPAADPIAEDTLLDPNESLPPARTILPQYKELLEMNPDFLGWISIKGTVIDYPVMYSPDRPEFYLDHAFDGSASGSGVPFIDYRCPVDGNYYLIYGHHMQNKTMFAQLLQYDSKSFFDEHPTFRFDTIYEEREYQVMAAFRSRVYGQDETNEFCYYRYFDLSQEEVFDEYVRQVLASALYDTGVKAEYGDELLAFSTCSYHVDNGRFVLVAKRVA